MLDWVRDPDVCFLFWFPAAYVREEARQFLDSRGVLLKELRIPVSERDVYGWMLYLYADKERPYVVDLRTVRNKARKCGWKDSQKRFWYIWIWKGQRGWAETARGSSAPLKTFLRALGAGWKWSEGTEIPDDPEVFRRWWGNYSARLGLTLEKWKSVLHIPDSLADHPRIGALLFHRGTGDWFRGQDWVRVYREQEGEVLRWLGSRRNEEDESVEGGWVRRGDVYFLCKWFAPEPPILQQITHGSNA